MSCCSLVVGFSFAARVVECSADEHALQAVLGAGPNFCRSINGATNHQSAATTLQRCSSDLGAGVTVHCPKIVVKAGRPGCSSNPRFAAGDGITV